MKNKTVSLLLALTLALSLAGCEKEEAITAPAGVAVQVQTVEAQDIASENTVSGQVTAGSETSVYVTATAKCTAVYVEAGDAVKAGDMICSLDMESSLAQYRAAVENNDLAALTAYLAEIRRRIAALDEREPENMSSEAYDEWSEEHEQLEDLADDILDRIEE